MTVRVLHTQRPFAEWGICTEMLGEDFPCPIASAGRPSSGACQTRDVSLAMQYCSNITTCAGVVLNPQKVWTTVKCHHVWLHDHLVRPGSNMQACKQLHRTFLQTDASTRSHQRLSCTRDLTRSWDNLWCRDYVGEGTLHWGKPIRIKSVIPLQPSAQESDWSTKLLVVAFANKGERGLCRLLLSAARFHVPVTVLGWQPKSALRMQWWYCASKFLMTSLWTRRLSLEPDAPIIILDGLDVMFQSGPVSIIRASRHLLDGAVGGSVFSAEAYCIPCTRSELGALAKRARMKAPHLASGQRAQIFHFLNSGAAVVRTDKMESLLSAYVRQADKAELAWRQEPREAGELAKRCVLSGGRNHSVLHSMRSLYMRKTPCVYHYNDQGLFKELLLAERHGIELDYDTNLVLSLFSSTPKSNIAWRGGRMVNLISNTTPPIIHFNGGIAGDENGRGSPYWMEGYRAANLIRQISTIEASSPRVRHTSFEHFRFVSPQLNSKKLRWSNMCMQQRYQHP